MKFFSTIRMAILGVIAAIALVFLPFGCSQESKEAGKEQHDDHEGHDHEGDDHEGDDHEGHDHEGHDHKEGEKTSEVHVTEQMKKTAGIVVAPVEKGEVHTSRTAPAYVIPTQEGEAHVGAPIAGRITRLYAAEGATVAKGAALAEIEAPGVAELQSDYLRALAEEERAQAELKRNETLGEERIGARRSLEEARAAWRQAIALRQSLAAQLQSVGISADEVEKGGALSSKVYLRAPVSGVVSRRQVALGEYLQPERDAFRIVNTATVWVDAQVAPERVALLRAGQTATVRGGSGERRSGRIVYISPVVDSASRTVTVRLQIDNRDNAFRPQSYATVEFNSTTGGSALVVPRRAIELEDGKYFVYREITDGFERVEIAVGATTEQDAEISAGIEEGARIAVDGIFYLKSIRKSEELAEHHH